MMEQPTHQISTDHLLHKLISHLIILLFSLNFLGCEWKPPRRPVKELVNKEQAVPKYVETISSEASMPLVSKTGSQKATPQQTNTPDPLQSKPKQNDKQVKRSSSKEELAGEKTDQIDSGKSDFLLTIDPDGPPLIHIKELIMATKVKKREPKGIKRSFLKKDREVLAFLRVRNFEKEQKIKLKWIYQEEVVQQDRLKIGISPRWRTWSSLKFNKKRKRFGDWRIEVSTNKGKLLGVAHFTREK